MCAVVLMVAILSGQAQAKRKYELTFTSVYQEKHFMMQNCLLPWMEEVKQRTGGRVEIHYYTPGTLAPDAELYDSVVSGALDMGCTMVGRNPGKFPYTSAFDEPLIAPGAAAGSVALWHLYQDTPEIKNEFAQTKVLTLYTSAPMQILSKRPLKALGDLKGKKLIITGSGSNELVKALGASPVMLPWPEIYLSLERGMADGLFAPLAQVRSYKLNEVCKYMTVNDLRLSAMYIVMNKNVWNNLPEDIRKILDEMSGESLAARIGKTLDHGTVVDGQWMKGHGHTFHFPTAEERAAWEQAVLPLRDRWIRNAEGEGLAAARKIMDLCVEYGKKYAQLVPERGYMGE